MLIRITGIKDYVVLIVLLGIETALSCLRYSASLCLNRTIRNLNYLWPKVIGIHRIMFIFHIAV